MKKIVLILLIAAFAGTAYSQVALTSAAPIVTRPSGPMAWKMTVVHSSSAPSAGKASAGSKQMDAISLDYITDGAVMKITVNYESGTKQDFWQVGHVILSHIGKSAEIQAFAGELPRYPYAARGFFGIENVRTEHAKGVLRWEGIPCQYYSGKRNASPMEYPMLPNSSNPAPEIQYEAWFDLNSGLPKAYQAEGKTWVFEFLAGAPSYLALPPEWQTALDKYRLDLRRVRMVP